MSANVPIGGPTKSNIEEQIISKSAVPVDHKNRVKEMESREREMSNKKLQEFFTPKNKSEGLLS